MTKAKKCIQCESIPNIKNNGDTYAVECCEKSTDFYELMDKAINEWNEKVNIEYYYLVGILYDSDEDENFSRNLDFMIEYDSKILKEIEIISSFKKHPKLFKNTAKNINETFPDAYQEIESINTTFIRGCYQGNLKRICKFNSSFPISRKEMENLIKCLSKEKIKNATVRRY